MGVEADREVKPFTPSGPVFWIAVAAGWAVMAYGVIGALGISQDTHPRSLAIWIAGSLIAHDFVIAPVVFVSGRLLRGVVPAAYRTALRVAIIVSAALVVISVPVIGRFGARRDNPTLLPHDAQTGLIVALAAIWILTAVIVLASWRRRRTPA